MKKGKILQLIIAIGMIVLSFVIVVFANSISFEKDDEFFSWKRLVETLKSPAFFVQTVGIALLLETSYIGIYLARDAANKSGKPWLNLVDEYQAATKIKEQNHKAFTNFVRDKNFELKKEAYRLKYEKKRQKYYAAYDKIPNEKLGNKRAKRIKAALNAVEAKLNSPELDKNVLQSNAKYVRIKIEDFGRQVLDNRKTKYDFKNEQNIEFSKNAAYKLVSKIVWATLFSAVSLQAAIRFDFGSGFWFVLSSCGLGLVMTISGAISIADRLHEQEAVAALSNRIAFINDDFNAYLSENHIQTYEDRFNLAVNDEIEKRIKLAEKKEGE